MVRNQAYKNLTAKRDSGKERGPVSASLADRYLAHCGLITTPDTPSHRPAVRHGGCSARRAVTPRGHHGPAGAAFYSLDVHVITVPALPLDRLEHQQALRTTVAGLKPKLRVLDPLVCLHGIPAAKSSRPRGGRAACIASPCCRFRFPSSIGSNRSGNG
jgi:hypothetical protein